MPASDSGDDFVGILCPDEGLRTVVGVFEEAVDGGLEIDDRVEDAALETLLCELCAPQSALAAITVDMAEIVNGRLVVSGRKSSGNETIRIVGTEYFATSGATGDFLLRADFVPPNCVVALATANETTGELPVANCTRKGVAEPVTPAAADYYVQVSTHGTEEAAQAKLRELLAQSPNLFGATPGVIQRADLPQGLFFLVQFGPMVGQANAEALRQSLLAAGIDAFVTRHAVTLVPVTFTVVQANWGELQYAFECGECHGDALEGGNLVDKI